jgi:Ca2+/Na+ antiporter
VTLPVLTCSVEAFLFVFCLFLFVVCDKKNKKQTKRPQQNMLNQVMSLTTNKNKQKTNKKASTEHVKSGYVTHNKQKTNKKASTEHAESADVCLLCVTSADLTCSVGAFLFVFLFFCCLLCVT